ncbi:MULTISPECIES: DUF427 domain-containing protein [Cryobacterium]|uniref:DUF427 domain-containing protein n=1 Tax=Cryobacterium breve TaxID=1259258 RepID=A0ABY2IXW4_9MICO|nr:MULTISPECIES: DUF427 domain-containing protein [Cryobacterium]TFC96849.1 DUF427 domain-containing protein [Cryobacterium sp. TmT3-12]TFC97355.1 DUF427 domain-containing protein [Cryobacterium breve]
MKPHRITRALPGPGQESVWDYPRPPLVEKSSDRVVVTIGGVVIADTIDTVRVLETSHPPVYYLPRAAFRAGSLEPAPGRSYCEFKGEASYLSVVAPGRIEKSAAWYYAAPTRGFEELVERIALYPGRMDRCTVNGERVEPQPGDFYGGWITSRVVGPFKGAPGSLGW